MSDSRSSLHETASGEQGLANLIEEITQKTQEGQRVDVDSYVRKYPRYADQLRALFPALRVLADFGASVAEGDQPAVQATGDALGEMGTLGDFRVIREIGRGGMGVVYEAEQISLGRRVALKVLPFAAVLDPRQLQRFQNEARAAATLDHPHIVHIHSVGSERGVHYYAMQYVEGRTLAQVIEELRNEQAADGQQARAKSATDATAPYSGPLADGENDRRPGAPSRDTVRQALVGASTKGSPRGLEFFRSAANLAIQAAEALEHAHQLGVVHRDVKPSNLMLECHGHLWITDFGLAMTQNDAAMTATGDVVGTLRYMSPEQALGKRHEMDHRTDIYSLGVTLYELLTLRPAFGGDNRSVLLRRLAEEDPSAPRTVDRAIPKDLETIVLKAIAKEPSQRFATAQEMADDLKRFLADEPIHARRPSLADYAAKWARRHRPLVWSAVALLVLSTITASISTLLIARAYQQKNQQLTATEKAEQLAREQERLAKEQQRLAAAQREAAIRQRDVSDRNLYVAHMRLAQRDSEAGQVDRLHQMLDSHLPELGRPDLRGWEWYYLLSLCHGDLMTLRGHDELVTCVDWSPDGERIASGSRAVKIWNAATGQEIRTIDTAAYCVAWSPDGKRLATASGDRSLGAQVWEVATGKLLFTCGGSLGKADYHLRIHSVAWRSDGARLVTASSTVGPGTLKVWDANDGHEILDVKGRAAWRVAWSPDGKRLAAAASARSAQVKILDAETGREIRSFTCHANLYALAWSRDGKRLAVGGRPERTRGADGSLCIWDPDAGREVLRLPYRDLVLGLAWSADSRRLATAADDQTIRVWDAASGTELVVFHGHRGRVACVTWSPDGKRLASGGHDFAVKIWDAGRRQGPVAVPGVVEGFSWSPRGDRLATVDGKRMQIWDPGTGKELLSIDIPANGVVWKEHGSPLAVCEVGPRPSPAVRDVRLRRTELVDLKTRKAILKLPDQMALSWSCDNKYLAVARSDENAAEVWDIASQKRFVSHAGPTCTVQWSPDATPHKWRVASGGWGSVTIWDPMTGQDLLTLSGRRRGPMVHAVAWSPDGKRLASGGQDLRIKLWDTACGRELFSLVGHTGPVFDLAWSPDGKRLVSGGLENAIKIWDTSTGQEVFSLPGTTALWSPDGRRLATRDPVQGLIRVHDAATGYALTDAKALYEDRATMALRESRVYYALRASGLEKAIEAYTELIRRSPQSDNYLLRGNALLRKHDSANAIADYDQAIRLDPKNALAYAHRGMALFETHHCQQGIADLTKAVELAPCESLSYCFRAQAYTWTGDRERALADAEKAVAIDPRDARNYVSRGGAYWLRGENEKALADSGEALRLDPQSHQAYYVRGLVYLQQGNLDKAIADLNQAIWIERNFARAYTTRADAYRASGDVERALADANEALRLDGDDHLIYHVRGCVPGARGDFDKAIADFTEQVQRDPKAAPTYGDRAAAYSEKGEYDRASADLSKWIDLRPDDSDAWCQRATVTLAAGRRDQYRKTCDEMLQRFSRSKSGDAAWLVAWTCAQHSHAIADWSPALALAKQAARSNPESSACVGTLGAILYRAGDYQQAVQRLAVADRLFRDPSERSLFSPAYTWFFLAMAHSHLGHGAEAQKWLDKAGRWSDVAVHESQAGVGVRLPWCRRLGLNLLRQETEALLKRKAAPLPELPAPQPAHAHLKCGRALADENKLSQAIDAYSQAIRVGPVAAEYFVDRADAHARKGDLDLAIADYTEALRIDSADSQALVNRGSIYFDKGQLDKAQIDFKEALRLNPSCGQDYLNRAEGYHDSKQVDRALAAYRKAMRLDPQSTCSYVTRCGLLKPDRGKLERALADFRQLTRLRPEIPPAWLRWLSCWLPAVMRGTEKLPGIRFVSDMPWVRSTQGWGLQAPRPGYRRSASQTLGGFLHLKVLSSHAFDDATPADCVLDISGLKFALLKALVGPLTDEGSVQFQVLVDGKVKYETPVMRSGGFEPMCVNVAGGKEVVIRLLNGGDGFICDSAGCGFARFIEVGAEDPLEEPGEIRSAIEANAALFLVEVHCRLGQKALARRWYDAAVAWMDKNKTEAEKLRQLRQEAEGLIRNAEGGMRNSEKGGKQPEKQPGT